MKVQKHTKQFGHTYLACDYKVPKSQWTSTTDSLV